MSLIKQNLADLKAQVGEEELKHLPSLHSVECKAQHEYDDGIEFKIFYGSVPESSDDPILHIWIYLIPSANPRCHHELRFASQDVGLEPMTYPAKRLHALVETTSPAFQDVKNHDKVRALAKYYFLELMLVRGITDKQLTRPFELGPTFIGELKKVCERFAKEAAKKVRGEPSAVAARMALAPWTRPSASSERPATGLASRQLPAPVARMQPVPRIERHRNDTSNLGRSDSSDLSEMPPGLISEGNGEQVNSSVIHPNQSFNNGNVTGLGTAPSRSGNMMLSSRRSLVPASRPSGSSHRTPQPTVIVLNTSRTGRSRDNDLDTFNAIRAEELELDRRKQRIQQDMEALEKEMQTAKAKKRELLESMSHEEQLDFVHEAGRKAQRMG